MEARRRKVQSAVLFPLIVLLCNLVVVSKAQIPDLCTDRYAVVNLWKEFDIVDFFCYLSWSFCEFRYYPPGTLANASFDGDNEPGFTPFVFNFGGVVRSNFQQDYRAFPNFQSPVGMPRPPDAGRFFAPHFSFGPETDGHTETCGILALSQEATLTFQYEDQCPETITVGKYEAIQKEITFTGTQNVTIRVTSTAPIIISCLRQEATDFYTWQPISSEPVFIFLKDVTESVAVTLSHCETNDEIKDINRVKLEYGYLQANGECSENVENSSSNAYTFGVGSTSCGVYIVPVDNETCVSAVKTFNGPNPSPSKIMGQALSKGVTQFGNLPFFDADVLIFSNSDQNCKYVTVDTIENVETVIDSNWTGELASKLQLERIPNNDFYILECSQPVLLIDNGELSHSFQGLGRQAEEAWKPFFIAEGCEV